jgi:ComF family protein
VFAASERHFVRWRRRVGRLAEMLVDALLPPACAFCGRPGQMVCLDCLSAIQWVREPVCELCGRPVQGGRCRDCRTNPPALQTIRSATYYQDPVKRLVHRFKYEGLFALSRPLGRLMVEAWPAWERPVDLVVPIPLHSRRRSERGYNQSELLVTEMCRHVNLTADNRALTRVRWTQPQLGLTADERRANVHGAFVADPARVAGKRVLLVDDVCTTGSTLTAAAMALQDAGALAVRAYCLCTVAARQDIPFE